MSACPQCGTVARPIDKFCNVCGTPIPRPSSQSGNSVALGYGAPPAQFATPPPPPGATPPPAPLYGGAQAPPAPARCQMGHDIAPGANYCAQGHPLALDQMQFAQDAYGGAYGGPPPPPQQGLAGSAGGYGAPPAAHAYPYGAPPPAAFGVPPGYGGPPQPAPFGASALAFPQPAGSPSLGPPQPPLHNHAPSNHPQAHAPAHEPSREVVPAKILRGFLVAYGTNPSGDFWPLTAGRLIIGRAGAGEGLDIPLQDPTISSRHAALVVDGAGGVITVEDTGSTNGTFVNDEHIGFNGRRDLRDGDRIRFGGFTAIAKVIGRS